MAQADPNRFPKKRSLLRTLKHQLQVTANKPHIGVTQGGSSRKFAGAKPAATKGLYRPPPKKRSK